MKYILFASLMMMFAACTDTGIKTDETVAKNEQPALPTKNLDTNKIVPGNLLSKGWVGVEKMNEETFRSKVPNAPGLTLVDFSAVWCGPCKKMEPVLHSIAEEMKGQVNFANVDVDESPNIAAELNISSIPLLVFYKDGKIADQLVGLQSKESLKNKIQELLSAK